MVEYTYDAWGKPLTKTGTLATTLGTLNPFRYRGYVYDEETGLYYLRSRYYNPVWGRFVNGDSVFGDVGSLFTSNLFSYCRNSCIGFKDSNGHSDYVFEVDYQIPDWLPKGSEMRATAKRALKDYYALTNEVYKLNIGPVYEGNHVYYPDVQSVTYEVTRELDKPFIAYVPDICSAVSDLSGGIGDVAQGTLFYLGVYLPTAGVLVSAGIMGAAEAVSNWALERDSSHYYTKRTLTINYVLAFKKGTFTLPFKGSLDNECSLCKNSTPLHDKIRNIKIRDYLLLK